ncbi:MAG TPA: neutral zinc metallopeptidase [Xanthomonadales bacterium]|nr:neutral zinc metallopeptidase [Xanthomonadales bacterium]
MKWKMARQSQNIEDRRGGGVARAGGLGLGSIAIAMVVGWFMGVSPMEILGLLAGQQGQPGAAGPVASTPEEEAQRANDPRRQFVASILGETEDVWGQIFGGQRYPAPKLVLFEGAVSSACGQASSATGPFYCPGDQQVYIDLGFFAEMQARLGGGGDFAEAYVIAHEVGHHIQTLTGVSRKVNDARRSGEEVEGDNGLLVRQELQADCYAGVWAHHAQARHQWLEEGDIEEAMNTASAIGDDRLQKQSRGQVVPDAFTHGTSAQRVRWFTQGFRSGKVDSCDTFAVATP